MTIICEHQPDCSKPDSYCCYSQYLEIYNSIGELHEIIPDDSEPHMLVCTECNMPASIEAEENLKALRKQKADQVKKRIQGILIS
jgi:hypothetical protein